MHELVGPRSLESDTNAEANGGLVGGPAQVKPGLDPATSRESRSLRHESRARFASATVVPCVEVVEVP